MVDELAVSTTGEAGSDYASITANAQGLMTAVITHTHTHIDYV